MRQDFHATIVLLLVMSYTGARVDRGKPILKGYLTKTQFPVSVLQYLGCERMERSPRATISSVCTYRRPDSRQRGVAVSECETKRVIFKSLTRPITKTVTLASEAYNLRLSAIVQGPFGMFYAALENTDSDLPGQLRVFTETGEDYVLRITSKDGNEVTMPRPAAVASNGSDMIYVLSTQRRRLYGLTIARHRRQVTATIAFTLTEFAGPKAVYADPASVFLADSETKAIYRLTKTGKVLRRYPVDAQVDPMFHHGWITGMTGSGRRLIVAEGLPYTSFASTTHSYNLRIFSLDLRTGRLVWTHEGRLVKPPIVDAMGNVKDALLFLPSGLAVDQTTKWLYLIDGGLLRFKILR